MSEQQTQRVFQRFALYLLLVVVGIVLSLDAAYRMGLMPNTPQPGFLWDATRVVVYGFIALYVIEFARGRRFTDDR